MLFGKGPRVNPLESQKRLLIAESEVNRAQLVQEWASMTTSVRTLTERVKTFGSIGSAAALLVAGLAAFRRDKSGNTGVKLSSLQAVLKGASMVSSLWLAFRAKDHDQENKQSK